MVGTGWEAGVREAFLWVAYSFLFNLMQKVI
jgi:hypothetical protein